MHIYESNYFCSANHPNEWETAITIDMHNGKVLNLGDIAGGERTIGDLFNSGAFHCMWFWGSGEEEYLEHYKESTIKCSEYSGNFYITDKSLVHRFLNPRIQSA